MPASYFERYEKELSRLIFGLGPEDQPIIIQKLFI